MNSWPSWLTTPIVTTEPWATWQRASGTIQCLTGPGDLAHPPSHSQIAHASENSSCHGNHCFALLLPDMHSFSQCVEKQIGLWQSTGGLFGNESWGDWSGWKTHEGKKTHSNQTNKKRKREEESEQRGGADFGSWSFQQSESAGTWYHLDVICPSRRWADAGWVKE